MVFNLGEELLKEYRAGKIALRTKDSSVSSENISAMIDKGAEYEIIIKAIAKIPLEGERERYIALLKEREKKNGVTKEAIRKDIQYYLKCSFVRETSEEERKELTEEETRKALAILEDRNFWETFLKTTEDLGYVGEEENKVMLYLTMTSRKLNDPIGIIVKGESAAGKSYLVSGISQFFPKNDILELTALTPKALYHRKDNLKNKVLIIYERSGAEEADYSLRILQSEKKLIFSIPLKNPLTNSFETQDIEVEGPISYIETTTKPHIYPENETRCFNIYIDESEEQTRRIHKAQNRKHAIQALDKEAVLKPWKDAQRLLKPHIVYIPYIDLIKFPTKPLRVRRDKLRFLSLIESSALLSQYRREKKITNGREFVMADIEDYVIAYSLADKILESVLKGLSPKLKELIKNAEEKFKDAEFKRKDLKDKILWNEKTLEKYMKEALDWGYFEVTQEGGKGKPYLYKLLKTDTNPVGLLTPEELAEEISKIPTNPQMGDGDFKTASVLDKQANPQYPQGEKKGEGIYSEKPPF
jgi:hypothetical protein